MISEILGLVKSHEEWRGKKCINLIPSENIVSPQVRGLLSSELGHRYTARDRFYMGTRFLDEVEKLGEEVARKLFKSDKADLRPLSGHIADLIVLASFSPAKGKVMCVSQRDGGYPGIGEDGLHRFLKYKLLMFPYSEERMNITVKEASTHILKQKPNLIVFGQSIFLFPHPVEELSKAAEEVGATVSYDGSHVLGLIAGGKFQDPLREGASILFGSTHKTFFGPQGGIILANKEHGEKLEREISPAFVDNAHWNRIAALTLALIEAQFFGEAYADQTIKNANTLAKALDEYGFPVACGDFGHTQSHQVYLRFGENKRGRRIARKLEATNIIVDCGVRLGTCEVTRRGMKENEMLEIADFIRRVLKKDEDLNLVRRDVEKFVRKFREVEYCFEK